MLKNIVHSKFLSALQDGLKVGKKISISCNNIPAAGYQQPCKCQRLPLGLNEYFKDDLSCRPDSEPVGMRCESREIYAVGQDTLQDTKDSFTKCQVSGSKPGNLNKRLGHFQVRPAEYL